MDDDPFQRVSDACIKELKDFGFDSLGISQYNIEYIDRLLPDLEYFFKIYEDSVRILLKGNAPEGLIVDYGGGHGFLSLYLKKMGFKVIYCDYNPLSVTTITLLKEKLGYGPDHIVEGTSLDLLTYCRVNKIKPAYLIGTDLIEHVYDLDVFFADLYQINPAFQMLFTTGSNPCNPYKVRNLRKIMTEVERSMFLPMREDFIRKEFPDLSTEDIGRLVALTRGKTYKDITDEIEDFEKSGRYPLPIKDKYNTCDPQSGNWLERILPLKAYREILNKNSFKVEFRNGFYNDKRKSGLQSLAVKMLNLFIRHTGSLGRIPAAYLILHITPR